MAGRHPRHPHPVLRALGPADAPAVVPLLRELCGDDPGAAQAAFAGLLAGGRPGQEAWVLELGSEVVGLLALAPSSQPGFRVGFVEWLAGAATHRRRGLGRRLVAFAQERAQALGWRQLHALTYHTNRPALHLYVEAGFYPEATLHDYAGPGVHYVELVWPVPAARGPAGPEGHGHASGPPRRRRPESEHRGGTGGGGA
jgi:ribosomal protein S18 acetylase RimI-like enzyme